MIVQNKVFFDFVFKSAKIVERLLFLLDVENSETKSFSINAD